MMTRIILLLCLLTATFAAAEDAHPIRICVGPLENHSTYQLPTDKLQAELVSQLSHKHIRAVIITGQDLSAEMAKNSCEYLFSAEFSNSAIPRDEHICDKCPVVDERKHFALQFGFYLKKSPAQDPVYSHRGAVIDKNPKTCADDHIWETVRFIRDYFKSVGKPTG
jgi:hypothetical protein